MVVSGSERTGLGGLAGTVVAIVGSGTGATLVVLLEGTVVVIVGSGEGSTVIGRLVGTVVVLRSIAGATVVVVVIGTGAGSTGVELLAGKLMEVLTGKLVGVVAVNRGEVNGILTGTGARISPATTDLIRSLPPLALISGFFNQK